MPFWVEGQKQTPLCFAPRLEVRLPLASRSPCTEGRGEDTVSAGGAGTTPTAAISTGGMRLATPVVVVVVSFINSVTH